jgi:oligopeptide/dipeptide ABC transporter ATP-binding protein
MSRETRIPTVAHLLEVEGLTVDIHLRRSTVHAVDQLTLHLDAGETVGLVGESGCGKSTTGLALLGLLPPGGRIAGGSIRVNGKQLVGLGERGMRELRGNELGMVFQDPMTALNPTQRIGVQVAEPLRIHSDISPADARRRAEEMLALVGLPRPAEQLDKYPHELSGGMRQRVVIATALICEPKVVIADEPTTALDVTTQDQILMLFEDLKRQLGMSLLLITHDMGVVAGHADRVLVMYAGRIVEEGQTDIVFGAHRHRYTEALLASIPTLDTPKSQRLTTIPGLPPDLTHPPDGCRFADRCRHASDRCRSAEPEATVAGPHRFSCHHPVSQPDNTAFTSPRGAGR